jgi:hypothetical protein
MIPVIEEAPLIRKLLEIAYDRLLPYENAEKPLLPSFERLVLQTDYVGFSVGAFDTPSALAYAASIRENEVDPPEPRILAAVESPVFLDRLCEQRALHRLGFVRPHFAK